MKLLVTGGAGFIGSCFVRMVIEAGTDSIVNLDKLTYAGNPDNVAQVANNSRYHFAHGNIAAESHVDRSILAPDAVFETNLRGTFTLLEAARTARTGRFLHVSTDEVYGSLNPPLEADESFPLRPSSPYSASK